MEIEKAKSLDIARLLAFRGLMSGNDRQNGSNPHEYRVFDLSICLVILD